MKQTGNEIISGVRSLWREWKGICSNIWEVIRCESPTCVLQQPCFSYTHIILHKLHHGEKWRWENAWEAETGCWGIWSGIQKGCCVIFLPLSLHPSLWEVWTWWDITTTTEETIICEYLSQWSVVSYSVFSIYSLNLMAIIHHSPAALIVQYLSFSSGCSPLLASSSCIREIMEQYSSSASLESLGPVL